MDIRKIKKLIDLVDETGVNELEVEEGEVRVKVVRYRQDAVASAPSILPAVQPAAPAPLPEKKTAGYLEVTSPMVGTFYASSSPDLPPFVKPGHQVKAGDTLCIVEAMKMFNHIEASAAGTVRECLVEDGQPVEYGQVLFLIEAS